MYVVGSINRVTYPQLLSGAQLFDQNDEIWSSLYARFWEALLLADYTVLLGTFTSLHEERH